jgi:dihydrofolate reductase
MGHTVVMGRKTFASIGRPLPGRKNVVLTRDPSFTAAGCAVVHSVGEALDECAGEEVYVIGGAEVFRQFYPYAAKMYVTLLDHEFAGDTFFPEIDENIWVQTEKRKGVTDEKNPYTYYFITYERKKFDVSPFAPGEAGLFH